MNVADRFASSMKRLREAAGHSQEELALRASVHRTQIVLIEAGERLPRLETLVKLAGDLGVGADDLLEGIVWRPMEISRGGFDVAPPERLADG